MATPTPMPNDYDVAEIEAASNQITRKQILQRDINWTKLNAAGILGREELRLINLYDENGVSTDQKVHEFRSVCCF